MEPLADVIRSIPIFSSLSREDVAKVLGKMEEIVFPSGATIFTQGEHGDALYLIQSGAVQVVVDSGAGNSEIVAVLGPRDWFGEMALMSGEPRSATIITVKESTLWRLRREDWDELVEKHPTWLLQFCATLSKRLSHLDRQYSTGREAFNSLAEEFYSSRSAREQELFRQASLIGVLDKNSFASLFESHELEKLVSELGDNRFPLIRHLDNGKYEFHSFFQDFLREKLLTIDGAETKLRLHEEFAARYEASGDWQQAIHHHIESRDWSAAARLLAVHGEQMLADAHSFVKNALESLPQDQFLSDPRLVNLKAAALTQLGDLPGAYRAYYDVLAQKARGAFNSDAITGYRRMAETLARAKEYGQAINHLRSALNLIDQENIASDVYPNPLKTPMPAVSAPAIANRVGGFRLLSRGGLPLPFFRSTSWSKWLGAAFGLGLGFYLWFGQPDIGLDPAATKLLGLISLTLIFWVFRVLPDYGVALVFAMVIILTKLESAQTVMGGFASTTWFMTLGVLGLGAAITGSGLFYRLSLHLVRLFPLSFLWQITATGIMGVVVMALIPQQTARTVITSQMLVNLSESLGYKTPSKASTGLFVASFLGLGQLGFLFLTGSTTSLIAWGLLPNDVRQQFTWGYWFIAALPPTLVVIVIILLFTVFLYRPESQPTVSYRMVQTQLEILGPLSYKEWVSFGVLIFTVGGWLTTSYHGIDGAWIAIIAFSVLINTFILDWGMMRKGIDWELLIHMGVTLSIPTLLKQAKIDQWLVEVIAPLILPFMDSPAWFFLVIAVLTYLLKLVFTSFLAVVTLCVALLPLSIDVGMSPWIVAMVILIASEVWFFPYQVDWHMLAYSTTDGKGFSYPLMCRINPVYALAYIVALLVAIPYWRYLGLMN
ncbi:MAG TPA: SLC13 family permease [Terriglobales bacterium]|nr:SLC13 family permease [Terriglobales bacterium]